MDDAALDKADAIAEREPLPTTWAEELDRAREIVRECGDLPSHLAYELVMNSPPDVTDPEAVIDSIRPAGAPPYPQTDRV